MEIDAETQTFRLKQSFVDKLLKAKKEMFSEIKEGTLKMPIRAWMAILSSLVYAFWTLQVELCVVSHLTEQMATLCEKVKVPKDWDMMWEFLDCAKN